jgi:hypothetical protein
MTLGNSSDQLFSSMARSKPKYNSANWKKKLPRQSNLFEKLGRGTNNKQRGGKSNQREKGTI